MSDAPSSLDAMSAELPEFQVAVSGGGAASSSSSAASSLGPFGKWKDPPSRFRYFNTCAKLFQQRPSAKQIKKEMINILRLVANERNLFNFPPESAGERTSCSVFKALMEHLSSAVFATDSIQRKVLATLGGAQADLAEDKDSVAASAIEEEYTVDNREEIIAAKGRLEEEIKTIRGAAAARKVELDEQVKSLRTTYKKLNEADDAKMEQISSKIHALKELYQKLSEKAYAASKAAAGGAAAAAASAAGGKRKASSLVKDPIASLESLIKIMDSTAAGKAALALLGSDEVNGAAALEAGKATKNPFTKDELFDELVTKHVTIVEESFLISLIHHGLVKDE